MINYIQLKGQKTELEAKLTDVKNAIEAIQKVCTHKTEAGKETYVLKGNDSHYDYYECSQCGREAKI